MTPEHVGAAVAEHGARALGGTGGIVYALEGSDTLQVIGSWGYSDEIVEAYGRLALAETLPAPDAARERRTVVADTPEQIAERYPVLSPIHRGSLCAVPMLAGEEVLLGAVAVSRGDTRAFFAAERELLEALGRVAGHALERASLHSRLHRLQATTADLARALTPQEVAATAALQGAEALGASSAWVALLDESRRSLELAHAAGHSDDTVQRFRSFSLDADLPLAEAARTRTPLWLEGAAAIFDRYPRFAEVRPQAQSAALLPLTNGGEALGAIGLVFDTPRQFGSADRDYLLTLTRLCGQALGRARVYQSEHDLALTLQQALLPSGLPRAEGIELAVRYLPTADGAAVGGDFYDALELTAGRVGIAVGDVVGHGPEAAAAMGQLRGALRAYALEGRSPARVLQLLSRYADGVPGARGATVAYAVIDPAAREVRYAAAGHPPPLLRLPDGTTRFLDRARGVPLDRALGHVYVDAVASVPEGTTLVLYSDGAIERRGEPLDAGLERLSAATAAAGDAEPEALATQLVETLMNGTERTDDVALLVARVRRPALTPLRLWFSARADQLAVVREAMRGWLANAAVDRGDAEMLVLAAGELCANAVEHAYPGEAEGSVEIALGRSPDGSITLVVRDRGHWRPPPADPGVRGRGLAIVRGLMSAVDIDEGADGTTVSARYRPAGFTVELPPPGPALVEIDRSGPVTVARIVGEIDELNEPHVEAELGALGAEPVVVDLSGLAFIGSAGIRILFGLAERVQRLVLVVPRDAPFRRALELAELGRVARLVEELSDA
ncbi:SpoIIE family protein phosphatase [Solirubrobacter phytolaccae]|uniref:SpoIIE family protein phosphatase n=1 Tax=Solirubrobacter phytolaccae TaxID=1404360 RepID=A0A9X3NP77_9ACTN|nr:SpoIIE family protein phosphatase [Solirubrobacter phytolaccae]MDA0185097.1 SpoIIE family protein phosphatase [Solirubrobacter phytolaccae]